MIRWVIVLCTAFVVIGCIGVRINNKKYLEGETWTYSRTLIPGIGSGSSWTFLANNNFTGFDWYSGGAYWRHEYAGKYYYDANKKTVFLKYDKGKAPVLKNERKQRLDLKIIGGDTTFIVSKSWKKPVEFIRYNTKVENGIKTFEIGSESFKIEKTKQ